jgi:hypothetical protein
MMLQVTRTSIQTGDDDCVSVVGPGTTNLLRVEHVSCA